MALEIDATTETAGNGGIFSPAEKAAILAGLRLLQSTCTVPAGINDILTDAGQIEPVSLDQIDALCERINTVDGQDDAASRIAVSYLSSDGFAETKSFANRQDAREYAVRWIGAHPEIGRFYAVSGDGIGRITVTGLAISDLFGVEAGA